MAVREGLLALLAGQENYGYQLKTGFEVATGGVWPLNVGQVYATLDRLARDGLVEVSEEGEQRSYSVTAEGLDELGAWWETVPTDQPPPRDELLLKVLLAVTLGRDHAVEVITRQRHALMALLQDRRRASPPRRRRTPVTLAETLMDDALVVRAEADLRWLDLCEERLSELPSEQPDARRGAPR